MKTKILKVVAQTETVYVQSRKSENGQVAKCYIRLRELGGEYENEYQCTLWGNMALSRFTPGSMVAVGLRFSVHETNGGCFQDILVTEIVPLN